jgi:hypothetical protein
LDVDNSSSLVFVDCFSSGRLVWTFYLFSNS